MRLVDNQKMVAMFNELILHVKEDNPCTKAKFEILRTEKLGLGWKYTWKCLACTFKSRKFSLYQEIQTGKPGPNPALVNMTLQAELSNMPIGNTARGLLTSIESHHQH